MRKTLQDRQFFITMWVFTISIWISITAITSAGPTCAERLDIISETAWPALQDFSRSILNQTVLVAISPIIVSGQIVTHAALHTADRRTYIHGNSSFFHLNSRGGTSVTRELVEIRGYAVKAIEFGADEVNQFIVILSSDGTVWSAGRNMYGNLAHHNTENWPVLNKVDGLPAIKQIATGRYHASVLTENGMVFSWGKGIYLGFQYSANKLAPGKVMIGQAGDLPSAVTARQICCGGMFCVALTEDQVVHTWGDSAYIGRTASGNANRVPGRVAGLSGHNVTQIACGEYHALAMTDSGRLYGWGDRSLLNIGAGLPRATLLDLGGKLVRDVVAGELTTIVQSYDEKASFFGFYSGVMHSIVTTTPNSVMRPRDLLAKSDSIQDTWGAVHLDCLVIG